MIYDEFIFDTAVAWDDKVVIFRFLPPHGIGTYLIIIYNLWNKHHTDHLGSMLTIEVSYVISSKIYGGRFLYNYVGIHF